MGKIKVLDEHVANQIAAGEVIERPSSVVKELVENALDAGSTRIDVVIEEGGLQLIRVADNGSGMEADDCELAFSRHATSKIESGKDLFAIRTLGFRGEALASIAAVAKVECRTSSSESGLGRVIVIEGGAVKSLAETAASRGTEVSVRELFYNTPARLKYMKTIQTELGHISDYIYRLALGHPDVAFSLKHNGNLMLQTIGNGDLVQVAAAIYGTAVAKTMLPVQAENPDYTLSGCIARPDMTRSNRNGITLVMNGRTIRNYGLSAAILNAYHTLLPVNRYPLAVLHIGMDPELVDVNVHPAKLEVRFSKEQELVRFVEESLRAVLEREVLIPKAGRPTQKAAVVQEKMALYRPPQEAADHPFSLPTDSTRMPELYTEPPTAGSSGPLNLDAVDSASAGDSARAETASAIETLSSDSLQTVRTGAGQRTQPQPAAQPGLTSEMQLESWSETRPETGSGTVSGTRSGDRSEPVPEVGLDPQKASRAQHPASGAASHDGGQSDADEAGAPTTSDGPTHTSAERSDADFPQLHPIGQLHGTYIVAQNEDGLFLIDQHAAHERINYEWYFEKFGRPAEASQQLLVPMTLEFTPSEADTLRGKLHLLAQVGVDLEPFGGPVFLVRGLPHWFPAGEEKALVEEMADWLLAEKKSVDLTKLREKAAIMCSCKASIKANQRLGFAEIEALLDRLAACRNPYTCPHGRPIVISFSTYELEKMFKRVM